MTLVEAPNFLFYQNWVRYQANKEEYKYLGREESLRGYRGEVVMLNDGSMDAHVRRMVRHMEVAGLITVLRRTV